MKPDEPYRTKQGTNKVKPNPEAVKLPDQLLVRYYRAAEIESITKVELLEPEAHSITVTLQLTGGARIDRWTDLGGGLGFIPASE